VEHVDLYLLHWPLPKHDAEAWRAMETLLADGLARAIGVCNYMPEQMDALLAGANVQPMVNQVEFHPHLTQPELQRYLREKGIVQEAWSPIMQGHVTEVPAITEIARRHGKSQAQVVLRWDLQHGIVTIPKSSNPKRIRGNLELFDFELSAEEMSALDALDQGKRYGPDPRNFNF
jgi:diketogulonate reductase-like aldo/keto reductase